MKRYITSDIHGHYLTFMALLGQIGLNKEDELYILGDFVNKGPSSKEVLDLVFQLQAEGYQIHCLKGNHEQLLVDISKGVRTILRAPETKRNFGVRSLMDIDKYYINWMEQLPLYFEVDDYLLLHAGLSFDTNNPLTDKRALLWLRPWHDAINYEWLGNRKVIHGHDPQDKNKILELLENFNQDQVLAIDNGCYMKGMDGYGHLCCVELNSRNIFFQENID